MSSHIDGASSQDLYNCCIIAAFDCSYLFSFPHIVENEDHMISRNDGTGLWRNDP